MSRRFRRVPDHSRRNRRDCAPYAPRMTGNVRDAARAVVDSIPRAALWVRSNADLTALICIAIGVRLSVWLLTERVWEDALITVTHARNALDGLGLVHHPGDGTTHGFTSALSVLIPLASDTIVRDSDLVAMRVLSIVAAVVTLVYAHRVCNLLGISRWPTLFILGYLALDQNHVFYGMAGMETQVAVAILLAGVFHVMAGHPTRSGVAIGLAMLARPDFILWAICGVAGFGILARRRALIVCAVAAVLVLPWVLFTTVYYGSPIPHTILAKSAAYLPVPAPGGGVGGLVAWAFDQASGNYVTLLRSFTPFYENTFVVAAPIAFPIALLVAVVVFGLAARGGIALASSRRAWPLLAFAGLYAAYRLVFLPAVYGDWYAPPFTAIMVILTGVGLDRLRSVEPRVPAVLVAALTLVFAVHLPFTIQLEARVQRDIETGVREQVGLYLRETVPQGEAVIAESAGYFEFYSGVKLQDYPGLTSETALQAVLSLPPERRDMAGMIDQLRAPWLVLRPSELETLKDEYPETASRYQVVQQVRGESVDNTIFVAGLVVSTIDREFLVLRYQ